MRRIAAVLLLLLGVTLAATRPSSAQTPPAYQVVNGFCFLQPDNTLAPCPASPTATAAPIHPDKELAVSGPTLAPAGTSSFIVSLTSRFLCFALQEPIRVYVLGNPGAAALTPLTPAYSPSTGDAVTVTVDPASGQATLSLEVLNAAVGPAGLDVKAVWPEEGVEKIVNVVPPAPPTPTSTRESAQPTATLLPTRTTIPTFTPSPTMTGTPDATSAASTQTALETSSPTATPTPLPPFTVRACVAPNPVANKSTATLYGLTQPGATCKASVKYSDGSIPTTDDFKAVRQTADVSGVVTWPLTVNTKAGDGTATVKCTSSGQSLSANTSFKITHA